MGISINDLSQKYQVQALQKVANQQKQKTERKMKYKNIKTEVKGIKFDSLKEARRYDELMIMMGAGMIMDLKLQEEFVLQRAYTTPNGERIRAVKYKADFTYDELQPDGRWEHIVEDVKGKKTQVYCIKKKMMRERLGIVIREV